MPMLDDTNKFGYAFVVDQRSDTDGIDISYPLFEKIAVDPNNPVPRVQWAPADPSNCSGIRWNGQCANDKTPTPAGAPTYCT